MADEHITSRLVPLLGRLKPKTKQPTSTRILDDWIAQAEGGLGDEAKGGRLGQAAPLRGLHRYPWRNLATYPIRDLRR